MNINYGALQRFLFSHHFYSGVRRAAGILIPIAILGGLFGWYASGLTSTFGALCVAFIDQPGPHGGFIEVGVVLGRLLPDPHAGCGVELVELAQSVLRKDFEHRLAAVAAEGFAVTDRDLVSTRGSAVKTDSRRSG